MFQECTKPHLEPGFHRFHCPASVLRAVRSNREVLPNPSLKVSTNGVARWPSSAGPAAHFALAVQRATPLAPP